MIYAFTFVRKWSFSLVLLVTYVAIFNVWRLANAPWITGTSGVLVFIILLGLLGLAARHRYFLNLWDGLAHGLVILDILLEGTLLRDHNSRGFYLCALAFAAVIATYRL